jgi:hypothetical protein
MNNISTQLTAVAPTSDMLKQASAWAQQALDMSEKTVRESEAGQGRGGRGWGSSGNTSKGGGGGEEDEDELSECRAVLAVARLNLGLLQEVGAVIPVLSSIRLYVGAHHADG